MTEYAAGTGKVLHPDHTTSADKGVHAVLTAVPHTTSEVLVDDDGVTVGPCTASTNPATGEIQGELTVPIHAGILWTIHFTPVHSDRDLKKWSIGPVEIDADFDIRNLQVVEAAQVTAQLRDDIFDAAARAEAAAAAAEAATPVQSVTANGTTYTPDVAGDVDLGTIAGGPGGGTPADGSITTPKLADNAVTSAKVDQAIRDRFAVLDSSTTVGRAVLSAASATAARAAIGAGTSDLQLGTGPTTAKAGNYAPSWGEVTSKPTEFTPEAHNQASATITDLTEAVQDIVAGLVVAGTNMVVSYDDVAGTFTLNSTAGGGGTDPEIVRDVIGAAIVAGSGIQATYDDGADTITISSTAVLPTRQVATGTGLQGGGDLTANRTLSLTTDSQNKLTLAASASQPGHTHDADALSDATITGKALIRAATAAAARTAIGAGTSSLALGTTGSTAAAGNDSRLSDSRTPTAHTHTISNVTGLQTELDEKVATTTGAKLEIVDTLPASDPAKVNTIYVVRPA